MIRNEEASSATQHIQPEDAATLTVTLPAGEYTVLCPYATSSTIDKVSAARSSYALTKLDTGSA